MVNLEFSISLPLSFSFSSILEAWSINQIKVGSLIKAGRGNPEVPVHLVFLPTTQPPTPNPQRPAFCEVSEEPS